MLKVHHLRGSQSERIVWLCEELALPYQLVTYQREANRAAPAAYKRLHPVATAPIIEDDGLILPESGAIVDFLCRRHADGRLIPAADDPAFADFLFWFHYANGSLMPAIILDIVTARMTRGPAAAGPARSERGFALVESRLGEARWFAGDAFTAADIMMVFPLTTMRLYSRQDISAFPNLRDYLRRIGERPAYQAAMAKAEPGFTPLLA